MVAPIKFQENIPHFLRGQPTIPFGEYDSNHPTICPKFQAVASRQCYQPPSYQTLASHHTLRSLVLFLRDSSSYTLSSIPVNRKLPQFFMLSSLTATEIRQSKSTLSSDVILQFKFSSVIGWANAKSKILRLTPI